MRAFFLILFSFSKLLCIEYTFSQDPIDVVIPAISKDKQSLDLCIKKIRENGKNIGRVIVVSKEKLTDRAEFFSEDQFPFSKDAIYTYTITHNPSSFKISKNFKKRTGWILQQLIKLYAPFVIPDISENVLVLDADTIFLRPVTFLDPETNAAFFNIGSECHQPFFDHAKKLIPGFQKVFSNYSGICHHMLLQKPVLEHLFSQVEKKEKIPFWKAFCKHIDPSLLSPCSEYEIYFNFCFFNSDQFSIRKLDWQNVTHFDLEKQMKRFDYVSCHVWQE